MTRSWISGKTLTAFLAIAALAIAQKPKSKAEADALIAIMNEQDPSVKIGKINSFIASFADTDFKSVLYTQAANIAGQKKDAPSLLIYAELAIQVDPNALVPMLMVSAELARSTRENDLDKQEKLARAERYARRAIELIPDLPKPNPQIPDEKWSEIKKEFMRDAHRDLGMVASARKQFDVAAAEFKQTEDATGQADEPALIRQAIAYNDAGRPDDALAELAKVCDPFLEIFVDNEQKRALGLKAAKGEALTPVTQARHCAGTPGSDQGSSPSIGSEVARIERGPHSAMPAPIASPLPSGASSGAVQHSVENRTAYTLIVLFSGPVERQVMISPGATEQLSLAPGQYRVAARVPVSTGVLPFFGVQSYSAGQGYSSHFYIQSVR
jgi:hypothetical protein